MGVDELEVDEMGIRRSGTTLPPYHAFHLIDRGQSDVFLVSFRIFFDFGKA